MSEKIETEEETYQRRKSEFVKSVTHAVNYSSLDTFCDTRDWIVAEYLWSCLVAYAGAHTQENYYKAT